MRQVLQSQDFYSDSCIPCKKLSPILADLDEKYPDVYIGKVNIVYEQELIEEYSVMSSPVLIFFKNGEEVDRITGAVSKHKIEEAIEKNKIVKHITKTDKRQNKTYL